MTTQDASMIIAAFGIEQRKDEPYFRDAFGMFCPVPTDMLRRAESIVAAAHMMKKAWDSLASENAKLRAEMAPLIELREAVHQATKGMKKSGIS